MKNLRFLPIAVLALLGSFASAQQQMPLGDVVRMNKPTKKATRVITNEDIPSRPDATAAPVDSTQVTSGAEISAGSVTKSKDKQETEAAAAKGKGENNAKKDSAEVAAMKSRLKELDQDIANLKTLLKNSEESVANADDERREILENVVKNRTYSLQHAISEHDELTGKLEEMKKPKSE